MVFSRSQFQFHLDISLILINKNSFVYQNSYQNSTKPLDSLAKLNLTKNPKMTHFENIVIPNRNESERVKRNQVKNRQLGVKRMRFPNNIRSFEDERHRSISPNRDINISNTSEIQLNHTSNNIDQSKMFKRSFKEQMEKIQNIGFQINSIAGGNNSKIIIKNDPRIDYQDINFDIKLNNKGKNCFHYL